MYTASLAQSGQHLLVEVPMSVLEQSSIQLSDEVEVSVKNGVIMLRKKQRAKFADFAKPLFDTINIKFCRSEANAR